MNFRDVEKKLCIYVDERTAKLLAPDVEANALLCMGGTKIQSKRFALKK